MADGCSLPGYSALCGTNDQGPEPPRAWRRRRSEVCPLPGSALRSNVTKGGDDPFGHEAPAFHQLDQKPICGVRVSPRLKDYLKNTAILVDRASQPEGPARNVHDNFIQVPEIAKARVSLSQHVGDQRSKLDCPAQDRLVRNVDATFQRQLFDRTQAQVEVHLEPDDMRDELGQKAIALIADVLILHRRHLR